MLLKCLEQSSELATPYCSNFSSLQETASALKLKYKQARQVN